MQREGELGTKIRRGERRREGVSPVKGSVVGSEERKRGNIMRGGWLV